MPWNLQANSIPTLLFKPARSTETITYSIKNELNEANLMELILFNARNLSTIMAFLQTKTTLENNSVLKVYFSDLINQKLDTLTHNRKSLHSQLAALALDNPTISIDALFSANSSSSAGSKYDQIFLTNIKNSLVHQLEQCVHEISVLKRFDKLLAL